MAFNVSKSHCRSLELIREMKCIAPVEGGPSENFVKCLIVDVNDPIGQK